MYKPIYIEKGPDGFGGPLVITPDEVRNKVMYILGEVDKPECLDKIVEISGMEPVDGFDKTCPENEIALAIVDCGGTLRCGIYPKKRIPTINIMPVGSAGPLAEFIVPDIYASAVGPDQVREATPEEVEKYEKTRIAKSEEILATLKSAKKGKKSSKDDDGEKKGIIGKLFKK